MTATQSATQTAAADRLDSDDTLCLRVVSGQVQIYNGMRQWDSTGHTSVYEYLVYLQRRGEDFARYFLFDEDGKATEVGV